MISVVLVTYVIHVCWLHVSIQNNQSYNQNYFKTDSSFCQSGSSQNL